VSQTVIPFFAGEDVSDKTRHTVESFTLEPQLNEFYALLEGDDLLGKLRKELV